MPIPFQHQVECGFFWRYASPGCNGFQRTIRCGLIIYWIVKLKDLSEASQHDFQEGIICVRCVGQQSFAKVFSAQQFYALFKRQVRDFTVNRVGAEWIQRQFKAKQHAGRTGGDLCTHWQAILGGLFDGAQQAPPAFRGNICLGQRDR